MYVGYITMYVLKVKIMLAEMMDLIDLTCFVADHMRWDNFSVTYVD